MSRGPDAAVLLERALALSAANARCTVRLIEGDWTRWASATFTGARHRLRFAGAADAALRAWMAALPDAELPLRGHLVADMMVGAVEQRGAEAIVELEVLTVEER